MQDATVQSIPQMSQAPAAVAPSSYVVAAPQAAPVNYQAAPMAYQVGTSYPKRYLRRSPVTNQALLNTPPNTNRKHPRATHGSRRSTR